MNDVQAPAVSVVISTYNRAELLGEALSSVLDQQGAPPYDVTVVDNNSRDATKQVALEYVSRSDGRLRYVFEANQGLCHGRNAGIRASKGAVVAFTDDDVRARPDWVSHLWRALEERPWAEYVGGKVLPRWPRQPPPWLDAARWAPLALLDHGDVPRRIDHQWAPCMVGANLAVRRSALDRFGLFDPLFQHRPGSVSAVEDHEWQYRVLAAGGFGAYVPALTIEAAVQENRLERAYHRRWHLHHGRAAVSVDPLQRALDERRGSVPSSRFRHWPGPLPPWLLRHIGVQSARFLAALTTRGMSGAFPIECDLREALGRCAGLLAGEHLRGSNAPGSGTRVAVTAAADQKRSA